MSMDLSPISMLRRFRRNGLFRRLLTGLLVMLWCSGASAETRGKLAGRVVDAKNEPVVGATVLLTGTTIGGAANEEGYYTIINIPPGVYTIRVAALGFSVKLIKDVHVNAGQTTTLNVSVAEEAIQGKEVTVVAERPLVDTRQTSAVSILGKDEINVMPVQSLNDIVTLQAGVVDGHFRGGRSGEVQYQVDGVSVNNPYDNSSVLQLDKSVIQEVQVISGTFDAEYGQAMSGVVNAVLRSGSDERYDVYAESYCGTYLGNASASDVFPHIKDAGVTTIQSYTLTLSGPTGLPQTSFLFSGRRYRDDGYLFGERRFLPTDSSDLLKKIFRPTGGGATVPMTTNSEWSWQFKLANHSLSNVQLSYQAIGAAGEAQSYDFAYRYNPDGRTTQRRFSLVHGLDVTHTLTPTTYYTVSLRQNYFNYTDWKYEAYDDPCYQIAGPPRSDANYELGAVIQGVNLGRFKQETDAVVLKASVTSQVDRFNLVKAGIEAQTSSILFGAPGTVYLAVVNDVEQLVSVQSDTNHPGARTYYPKTFAAFVQDRIEFSDILIRVGLRWEYFDAHAFIPSDLANPANVIQGAPLSHPQATTKKITVAPRLGISYPISERGAVYFSYGHFYQMPGLGQLYSNSDYSVLKNLQAGAISYGILGNPDLKPEFTTQYEFGVKTQFGTAVGVDLSVFYKDIRDLLGVEFVSTYTAADYARFTNIDFGSVYGVTVAYDQRLTQTLGFNINYTYQKAIGNASDPAETATRAAAGEDPRPRQIAFDWDQTHTINASLTLSQPEDYAATLIFRYGSGSPYTPAIGSGFGAKLEKNSSHKPAWALMDIRAEKFFGLGGLNLSLFARAFNLLDARYANGFVFTTTGSPDYSLTPAGDRASLINPTRYYTPRRVEMGISIKM